MAQEFRANPFEIKTEEGVDFADVLRGVFALSDSWDQRGKKGNRWGRHFEDFLIIDHLDETRSHLIGTGLRLFMSDLPVRGGVNGTRDLDLADEEGIGKHVAFLWDKDRQRLWFQRDRNHIAIGVFIDYLMDRTGKRIDANPVLSAGAIKKALKAKVLKSVEVHLGDAMDDQNAIAAIPLLGDILGLRDRLGAVKIEVRVTAARGESLDGRSKKLIESVEKAIDSDESAVRRAVVEAASSQDEKARIIDLLHDREDFRMPIKPARSRRPQTLMNYVRMLWQDYR